MRTLILAAGMGKRMNSKYPKVIHEIFGKPMILWVIGTAKRFGEVAVVLGHKYEMVEDKLPNDVRIYIQKKQLGTAHAVMSAIEFVSKDDNLLILYGDVPFISYETLKRLEKVHLESNSDVTILTAILENPSGYGRIVRDDKIKIIEDKDADDEIKKIKEINTGIYIIKGRYLIENINKINNNNAQGEYYLTDILRFTEKISTVITENIDEITGINDRIQLARLEKRIRKKINEKLMKEGVRIIDPDVVYIDPQVKIGKDTVIYPFTFIEGDTTIGEDCIIGPMTRIKNSKIGNNVIINRSEVEKAEVKDNVSVGPYARLREGTILDTNVKIGNFVETKKTVIGQNSKAQHLTYLGDATIGKNVNIGAGTITCNYDGKKKHPTFIEDNVFIGSNSSLVAPVKIGKNSITAAGSTITNNVPENSLAIARERQINKENWVLKKGGNKNANNKK
ncbi:MULTISPECIES: bifunctional UDP-N-acetylglucosamine diphosphorylase/glucosamine-1-phosphate N-acetyltransferase GlmU [unclassified Thermosipho (in: thermotogales)]|uniref:bifunctional UDP-N-acetylglucosamine diphosphorylase/glucosamine-1-phosphate N-acetyltransferase GlmU n=1 Tax=unclassified Thermosipho (in: thermotogales) TaxID=2676525 RepID=UPI000984B90A|nr:MULTISPECIES: bifunctional UDP-N-acetylglucosamine diphosphorylase/glucosamine-1-phosphate N-acetyltransferase GlmU [unclassified Thermosipho (in: thermotogales)]MBT1248550.1 bifunctional N-acetylglucosamine-1-phosphate uridyltransferase/glucosamine-1-phosphate acetyltransferase [Thermosipho sp. 1244]OOC47364.1 bifunctional N-acetylglucosamine-1-phosphate uridyltransferase/glucosamine-1-phosphate acetyltransferase [Thermosipho sp. 1223]